MSSSLHLSHLTKWLCAMPPVEWGVQQFRELLLGALRQGPVPQHIAFIMDGNRRFSRRSGIEVVEGHNLGFEALARVLEVCYKIGVKAVTIYAFSIENFKRSKYEVDALMDLAKNKFTQLAQHGEILERYGARLQFLGKKEMLRPDVIDAVEKAIALTSGNHRAVLNICAPYTSRDEITTAIRTTVGQYSRPLRPKLKRPFSESRIARTIRAQHLATVTEQEELKNVTSVVDVAKEEDFNYKPSSPESEAAFSRMTTIMARNMTSLPEDLEPGAADSLIRGAADEILVLLKEPRLSRDEKRDSINQLMGTTITDADFEELQELADSIIDFSPCTSAADASPNLPLTEFSASSTLNLSTKSNDNLSHSNNYPDPETITEETLTANTLTGLHTPPLDILIRTSGVERLSDFMLWQCHQETEIVFLKCLWPEFDLWQFFPVLVEWQWRKRKEENGDERLLRGRPKVANKAISSLPVG